MTTLYARMGTAALVAFALVACDAVTKPEISPNFNAHGVTKSKGKIVFASTRDGNAEIYVMNADGSELKNLTNHPSFDTQPSWSPNGKQIVFASDRRNSGRVQPNLEIHVMNADGSNPRRLTSTDLADRNPHFSPNGKQIVFTRFLEPAGPPPALPPAVPQNFVINVDGTGETNLTNNSAPRCFGPPFDPDPTCVFEAWPRWSPNGKKILFNRAPLPGQADIWVMNADGTGKTNLTNSPTTNDFFADWSPNGKMIAWSGGGPPGETDILVMNIDGTGLRRVTTDGIVNFDVAPVWSPNGEKIAFWSGRGGNFDIFTIHPDGTNETRLTTDPGFDNWPDWASGPVK